MQKTRPIRHTSRSNTKTRIHLDEYDAPISVTLEDQSQRGLVVTQELGFLRRHQEVRDEDGRSARIASIRLDTDSDVPKLVIELRYEEHGDAPRDPTLGYDETPRDSELTLSHASLSDARLSNGSLFGQEAALRARRRADQPTVVFQTTPDEQISTEIGTPPWLEERGSEMQLAIRETRYKWSATLALLAHGVVSALSGLRS